MNWKTYISSSITCAHKWEFLMTLRPCWLVMLIIHSYWVTTSVFSILKLLSRLSKKNQLYFPSLYGIYVWLILNRYANLLHGFLMLECCFIFSGVWLLVWEWVHALCLYPLSLWKCWTLWEQLSWAFCGWRTGSNSWMVGFLPFSCLFYDTC